MINDKTLISALLEIACGLHPDKNKVLRDAAGRLQELIEDNAALLEMCGYSEEDVGSLESVPVSRFDNLVKQKLEEISNCKGSQNKNSQKLSDYRDYEDYEWENKK